MVQNLPWPDVSLKHRGSLWDTAHGTLASMRSVIPTKYSLGPLPPPQLTLAKPLWAWLPWETALPG